MNLNLLQNSDWKIQRTRAVPVLMKTQVEKEIANLVKQEVLEPTTDEKFACPIVIVKKKVTNYEYVETLDP